jgi:hypothetical protein
VGWGDGGGGVGRLREGRERMEERAVKTGLGMGKLGEGWEG